MQQTFGKSLEINHVEEEDRLITHFLCCRIPQSTFLLPFTKCQGAQARGVRLHIRAKIKSVRVAEAGANVAAVFHSFARLWHFDR